MTRRLTIIVLLFVIGAADARPDAADAIYVNANVYTVDEARPRAEAIAVRRARILRVGGEAEVRAVAGPRTRVVDLGGMTVLPGLIDAHAHLAGLGAFELGLLDLARAGSFDEVVRAVERAAADADREGAWILGGRWDHESWPGKRLPTHHALSAATPGAPVFLRRVDGHAGLANAEAMRRAGVTRETADPPGGEILRDADGEPTGVFVDAAMALIERAIDDPQPSHRDLIEAGQRACLAVGLTGVHDAGVSPSEIEVYLDMALREDLDLRVYAMVSGPFALRFFEEKSTLTSPYFTVRAAKLYMDGAMGSRGAWLLAPYEDRPTGPGGEPYVGLAVNEPDFVLTVAQHGVERGYQVCTHAIGDRANREVLDAYEAAFAGRPGGEPRFRVEHAQLLHPDDLPRFAALGVIPSMQPTHCTSDMRWVEERVGPARAAGAYAWASLLKSGARLAGGSDFPVEHHNPFLGFYAAVTRQDASGEPSGGWRPEERMTRAQALRAFTIDAAYAAFEERAKGSLEPGKLADFIVIDRDVMACPAREILGAAVLRTVVGGETVYEAE